MREMTLVWYNIEGGPLPRDTCWKITHKNVSGADLIFKGCHTVTFSDNMSTIPLPPVWSPYIVVNLTMDPEQRLACRWTLLSLVPYVYYHYYYLYYYYYHYYVYIYIYVHFFNILIHSRLMYFMSSYMKTYFFYYMILKNIYIYILLYNCVYIRIYCNIYIYIHKYYNMCIDCDVYIYIYIGIYACTACKWI